MVGRKRGKISISPDPAVVDWIDEHTGLGKPFKDRTHAFEQGIARMMEEEATRRTLGLEPLRADETLLPALVEFLRTHAAFNSSASEKSRGKSRTESTKRQ